MLGQKISKIRQERNMSLRELARQTGIPVATICRIELGQVNPGWSKVCRIAEMLEVSLDELARKEPPQ